jgi:nucleotide-binding universal stress UspA family protein
MTMKPERPELSLDYVVFATDFSGHSEVAGQYAGLFAQYSGARLVAMHSFIPLRPAITVEMEGFTSTEQRHTAEKNLEEVAARLAPAETRWQTVLLEGEPAEMVARIEQLPGSSLLVMGTQGKGRIQHHLIGSTAEDLLRSVTCPVMTVGPNVLTPGKTLTFRNILYATDFSPEAMQAAVYAVTLAQAFGAHLHILNVLTLDEVGSVDELHAKQRAFHRELNKLVPDEARAFMEPSSYVELGEVRERILEHAKAHRIDLIVVGPRSIEKVRMPFGRGLTYRLIAEAECPVMTLRQ